MKREYIFPALKILLFAVQGSHQHCSPLPQNKHFYWADLFLHYLVISFAQRRLTWETLHVTVWKEKFVYNEQLTLFSSSLTFSYSVPDFCKPDEQWETQETFQICPQWEEVTAQHVPHICKDYLGNFIFSYLCMLLSIIPAFTSKVALNSVKNY